MNQVSFRGLTLCALFAWSAYAQSPQGTITGTVTDAQGGSVAAAQVTAIQPSTALRFQGTAAADGVYTIPSLPAGEYEVAATAPGFKQFRRTGLTLEVAQTLRVDITLEPGSASESITVTGDVPRVQTEDSTLGTVIETQRVQELPLNGRQPFTLMYLVAGVQSTTTSANGFADASNQGFSRLRINGGSTLGNQFFIDGAMDTVPAINEVSVVPMADSILEFRVETNSLKAEFGQTTGGVVNLVTKSGTNDLHGTAYEFFRNDALNARNAFAVTPDPNTGRINPILRYNQYGGTSGGPLWIPKVYNGRNRTFFFFGFEQWRYRGASVQRTTVPTARERSGDFSNTRDATGAVIPIYDPATTRANPNGSGFIRDLFPSNVVPSSRMDPLSLRVLPYMPLPNVAPSIALTNQNNFLSQVSSPTDQSVIDARIDHRFREADSMWGRYAGNRNRSFNNGWGLGVADPQARFDHRDNHNFAIGETHVFSPAWLNEFRASVTRQYLTFEAPSVGQGWPQKLAYPSILPNDEFPAVQIQGLLSLGYSVSGSPSDGYRAQFAFQIADSTTWVHDRHTVKFGIDQRWTRLNYLSQSYPSGQFSFTTSLTGNPLAPAGSGIGMASFLLGQLSSGQQTYSPAFSYKTWSQGIYVQDDYKATRRLTLNLGLRYDLSGPPTERYNRYSNFDPYVTNSQTGMRGELAYAGVNAPATFVNYDYNNFGPRVGFAYAVTKDNRTAIRGGFAIVYNPVESGDIHGNGSNALGFSVNTPFASTGQNEAFQFSAGPQALLTPAGSAGGPSAFRGQSVTYQDRNAPVPYAEQWNFTLQRQLWRGWTGSASYVGNHGVKLFGGNYNLNQLDPKYFSLGLALQNQVTNPFYGQILTGSLSGKTVSQQQLLLPFPDYQGISTLANHGADSIYHSLQANLEHRYSNGVTALVSYNKGKLIDDSGSNASGESSNAAYRLGAYNRRLDRALDATDVAQRLVVSGVWALPFAAHATGWRRQLIGGWQANGIITWQTGFPLAVTGANNFTGINAPNVLFNPALPASQRSANQWFNTAAFVNPPSFVVGNAPATLPAARGPALVNSDLAIAKGFDIRERWKLKFRAEAFNALNHVNYNGPNTSFSPNAQGVNTNALFAHITSSLAARAFQMGLHLSW